MTTPLLLMHTPALALASQANTPFFKGSATPNEGIVPAKNDPPSIKSVHSTCLAVSTDRSSMEAFFETQKLRYSPDVIIKDSPATRERVEWIRRMSQERPLRSHPLDSLRPAISRREVAPVGIYHINDTIGFGCFALTDIASGSLIGNYTGLLSTPKEAQRKNEAYHAGIISPEGNYLYLVVDGYMFANELRFVNHIGKDSVFRGEDHGDREPCNLAWGYLFHEGLVHILFVAQSFIRAGDELRIDYGAAYCDSKHLANEVYRLVNGRLQKFETE